MTHLHYSIAPGFLGHILMAHTRKGASLILMGDDENDLQKLLEVEYPAASCIRETLERSPWHQRLLEWLEYPKAYPDIPLDQVGTPFQLRVWAALCTIPSGETRSYQAIARSLGMPNATRAVANACAANRLALIIPCHRVIRSDGSLSGYRWGSARKQALLEREARIRENDQKTCVGGKERTPVGHSGMGCLWGSDGQTRVGD